MLLATKENTNLGQVLASIDADLMKNHEAGTAVDPREKMEVAQDTDGNPLIFSIGNMGEFFLIMRDSKSKTGWAQMNITSSMPAAKGASALTFEVSQGKNGQITILLALADKSNDKNSTLYVTPAMPNSANPDDWKDLGTKFKDRPFKDGDLKITKIMVGTDDDGQGTPMALVAGEIGSFSKHYQVNTNLSDESWIWKEYKLPENATEILDLAIGVIYGDRGVYALYNTATGQTLQFTSLPDPKYHKTSSYDFPLKGKMTSIAAMPSLASNSYDLYVSGEGVYMYKDSISTASPIAQSSTITAIHSMMVKHDAENVAIWTVSGDEVLSLMQGKRGNAESFSYPFPIENLVTQMAALRNDQKLTNELFVVKGDSTLAYLYQDAKSSLWQETIIPLQDTGKILNFDSYTSHINFKTAANSKPVIGQKVKITSSTWVYVTINGTSHSLSPEIPVEIETDLQGTITIISRTKDIASPIYRVEADFLQDDIEVHPAEKIQQGLKKVKTGSDFKNAKLKNGQPLITKDVNDDTLDSTAKAVQQLTGLTETLPQDGSVQNSNKVAAAMPKGAPSPYAAMNIPKAKEPVIWGMTFHEEGAQYHDGAVAMHVVKNSIMQPGAPAPNPMAPTTMTDIGNAIGSIAGDVLKWLEWIGDGLKKVGGFLIQVVEDVAEFIINVGGELFKFAIKTIQTAFKVINWVLKNTLGIDLEKILQWLGFIFDWEDIKKTKKVFFNIANQSLNYGRAQIENVEAKVNDFFENLKQEAQKLQPVSDTHNLNAKATGDKYKNDQSGVTKDAMSSIMESPGGNWGTYQLMHGGAMDYGSDKGKATDPLTAFMNDVLIPTVTSLENTGRQLMNDLNEAFEGGTLTVNQAIQKLGADLIIGFIDAIQKLTTGVLQFIADMVEFFRQAVTETIDIPFLSAFYKWIAGDSLSILDALCLVFAIPATIGYKLVANKAPFDDDFGLSSDGYEQIFGMFGAKDIKPAPGPRPVAGPPAPQAAMPAGPQVQDLSAAVAPAPEKEETNKGAVIYSQVGGFIYLISSAVADTLSLLSAITSVDAAETSSFARAEELEKKMNTYEKWSFGLSLVKSASSFPVGNDPEVGLQRGVWGIHLASPFIEGLIGLVGGKGATPVKGGWQILDNIVVFILEAVAFGKEMSDDENKNKGMDAAKFIQNIIYLVSGISGGIAKIDKEKESQAIAAMISGGTAYIAGTINLVRVVVDIEGELEHQNF